jgi:hypothetical protein
VRLRRKEDESMPPTPRGSATLSAKQLAELGMRYDVFPLGIINPEEFLVRFEHGFGPGA